MSAPVFDPALFGLTDQDPLADLQAASRIYNRIVAHGIEAGYAKGYHAGRAAMKDDVLAAMKGITHE